MYITMLILTSPIANPLLSVSRVFHELVNHSDLDEWNLSRDCVHYQGQAI